jgi:hypothetical protein
MPKKLKQTTLISLKTSGAFTLVDVSQWRRQRLLLPRLTTFPVYRRSNSKPG